MVPDTIPGTPQQAIDQWNAFEKERLTAWFGSYDIAVRLLKEASPTEVSNLIANLPSKVAPLDIPAKKGNLIIQSLGYIKRIDVSLILKERFIYEANKKDDSVTYVLISSSGISITFLGKTIHYNPSEMLGFEITRDLRDEGRKVIYVPKATAWDVRRAFEDKRLRLIIFIGHSSGGGYVQVLAPSNPPLQGEWTREYGMHFVVQIHPEQEPFTTWRIGPNLKRVTLYACYVGTGSGRDAWQKAIGIGVELKMYEEEVFPGARCLFKEWPWW